MGRHMKVILLIAIRHRREPHSKSWVTYDNKRCTVNAIDVLVRHGFLEVNDVRQFRLASSLLVEDEK